MFENSKASCGPHDGYARAGPHSLPQLVLFVLSVLSMLGSHRHEEPPDWFLIVCRVQLPSL